MNSRPSKVKMRPYKVMFVSSGGLLAGAERCLLELVSRLDPRRFESLVIVPYEGPLSAKLRERGIRTRVVELGVIRARTELNSPRFLWRVLQTIWAILQLVFLINQEGVDIVHTNTAAAVAGGVAAYLTRRKHVWHVREIVQSKLLWSILSHLILLCGTRIVCISSAVKDHFGNLSYKHVKKFCVIHDGIDIEVFAAYANTSRNRKTIKRVGTISRINRTKGHDVFIKAASIVAKQFPQVEFYIVGSCLKEYLPIKRELQNLAVQLGVGNKVIFTGCLDYPEVARVLSTFDVFVLPSSVPEGLGIVLLEAMAERKPVIATAHGGPLDIIDSRVGLLVAPGNPNEMAEAILLLLRNEQLARAMGEAGFERVRTQFTIDCHVAMIQDLYLSLFQEEINHDAI